MWQCIVKAVNEDLSNCLRDINMETLFIWDKDIESPLSDAQEIEKISMYV